MGSQFYVVTDDVDEFTHDDDPIKYKSNHDTLTLAVTKKNHGMLPRFTASANISTMSIV